jgi:hypothetical protein
MEPEENKREPRMHRALWPLVFLLVLLGCSRPADLEHPRSYDRDGISFDYPGNWTVTKEAAENGIRSIELDSPQGAHVSVMVFGKEEGTGPEELAIRYAGMLQRRFEAMGGRVEAEMTVKVNTDIDGRSRDGLKRRLGVHINEEKEVYHQTVYAVPHPEGMTGLGFQAKDKDVLDTIRGFELVLSSFRRR